MQKPISLSSIEYNAVISRCLFAAVYTLVHTNTLILTRVKRETGKMKQKYPPQYKKTRRSCPEVEVKIGKPLQRTVTSLSRYLSQPLLPFLFWKLACLARFMK